MSTWEQRMAARAAARAPRRPWPPPTVLQDLADNPWRYSPEPPPDAPCCATWRLDCHISDDPPIDRYMWLLTCGYFGGGGCDHEHHRDEIWLA